MNRKEKMKRGAEAVTLHRSFDVEQYMPDPSIVHLNEVIEKIRESKAQDRKNPSAEERPNLPVIFNEDNQLWERREAWKLARDCRQFVVSGKAAESFGLSTPSHESARIRFDIELTRGQRFYIQALAEQLKAVVRRSTEAKDLLEQVKFSFNLPSMLPPELESIIGCLDELIIVDLTFRQFERFVWSELPDYEKYLLRSHLRVELQELEKTTHGLLKESLSSLPKNKRRLFRLAWADFVGFFEEAGPKKFYKMLQDADDTQLFNKLERIITEHSRHVKSDKEAKYAAYVDCQDRLKREGEPSNTNDVCERMDEEWSTYSEKEKSKKRANARQGMIRVRHKRESCTSSADRETKSRS